MKYLVLTVACLALAVFALWRVMIAREQRAAAEIAALKQVTERLSSRASSMGDAVPSRMTTAFVPNIAAAAVPRRSAEPRPLPAPRAPNSASSSAVYADIQAFYQASLEAESVDASWSRDAMRDLRGVFDEATSAVANGATTLKSVECRQTICRAELTHDSNSDARAFMQKWMYSTARTRWKGPITGGVDRSLTGGAIRSVFFFGREGTELPAYN